MSIDHFLRDPGLQTILVEVQGKETCEAVVWYTEQTDNTAVYPDANKRTFRELAYLLTKLAGETGELADAGGKALRLRDDSWEVPITIDNFDNKLREKMIDELGDIFWYLARILKLLDVSITTVIIRNVFKLRKRKQEGTLKSRETT